MSFGTWGEDIMEAESPYGQKFPLAWRLKWLVQEKIYWTFTRRYHNTWRPKAIRAIPDRVKYFTIVDVAARYEPREYPGESTAMQMMKWLEQKNKGRRFWR